MRLWRRTQDVPPGGFLSLREAARNYGLDSADPPVPWSALVPRQPRVKRWWYGKRVHWARRIAP